MADEVKHKVGDYREFISQAEAEIFRLEGMMRQTATGRLSREAAISALESLRDSNLDLASLVEKSNLLAQLGIKVFPSDDGKVIRIASSLRFEPSYTRSSPQKTNMASPKL